MFTGNIENQCTICVVHIDSKLCSNLGWLQCGFSECIITLPWQGVLWHYEWQWEAAGAAFALQNCSTRAQPTNLGMLVGVCKCICSSGQEIDFFQWLRNLRVLSWRTIKDRHDLSSVSGVHLCRCRPTYTGPIDMHTMSHRHNVGRVWATMVVAVRPVS